MGLEGTLRAFSLSDIFQVLGLQRKSGVLVVESRDDTITISFLGGQVVSAESKKYRVENQLGRMLVRAGRLTDEQLARVLELQKETRQRLGFLLIRERLVSPEDLKDALRLQILRTLQRVFQWPDGNFRFSQDGQIEYDADHMAPVPTESVLMEAAQIHDELPRLQKKIPSHTAVFRRAPGMETARLLSGGDGGGEGTFAASRSEAEAWKWIDGKKTVAQILERAFLSDFDALKGLSDLMDRGWIAEGSAPEPAPSLPAPEPAGEPAAFPRRRANPAAWAAWAALAFVVAFGIWSVPRNPWNPSPGSGPSPAADPFFKSASLSRLVTLERGVRVAYDATGRYPRDLQELVNDGVFAEDLLWDHWGRRYRYILRPAEGKFGLYGRDARGEIDLDLSFDRALAPMAEIRPGVTAPRPSEARPAVQIVE